MNPYDYPVPTDPGFRALLVFNAGPIRKLDCVDAMVDFIYGAAVPEDLRVAYMDVEIDPEDPLDQHGLQVTVVNPILCGYTFEMAARSVCPNPTITPKMFWSVATVVFCGMDSATEKRFWKYFSGFLVHHGLPERNWGRTDHDGNFYISPRDLFDSSSAAANAAHTADD